MNVSFGIELIVIWLLPVSMYFQQCNSMYNCTYMCSCLLAVLTYKSRCTSGFSTGDETDSLYATNWYGQSVA